MYLKHYSTDESYQFNHLSPKSSISNSLSRANHWNCNFRLSECFCLLCPDLFVYKLEHNQNPIEKENCNYVFRDVDLRRLGGYVMAVKCHTSPLCKNHIN